MADIRAVASGKNPYEVGSYTAKSNEKNTLTIESYFKLLSAQLAHQDMSNPMDNSEMMAQMTQMAMVQSLSTMTSNMKEEMALTKTTYLAGLIGKEVTVKLPEKENSLVENQPKEKSGVIASVNLSGKEATFRIEGDTTEYLLSNLIQIGKPGTSGATAAATSGAAASTPASAASTPASTSSSGSAASSPAGPVSGVGAAASASGPSGS